MHAEILFENGWVYTGNDAGPLRANLAIAEGRIIAVGTPDELHGSVTPETRKVDLQGQLVVPGFQDAHIHPPIFAGIELLQCDLTEATSAEEAVARVARYAADNPDELDPGCWMVHGFFPGRHSNTGTSGRRGAGPARLPRQQGPPRAWANTAAFEAAGIGGGETPDPEGGRLEREEDGTPAGTVHEGAMDLFNAVKPAVPYELAYQACSPPSNCCYRRASRPGRTPGFPFPRGGNMPIIWTSTWTRRRRET